MLYNPKWLPETKPDIFSVEGFIGWLEQQPHDKAYAWGSPRTCAVAQYLGTHGILIREITYEQYNLFEGGRGGKIAMAEPHTFGAALARARDALLSVPTRNGTEA